MADEDETEIKATTASVAKVLCALNFYASGSYQRYVGNDRYIGLSQKSVSRCIRDVTNAICSGLFNKWIKFPINSFQQNKIKLGFNQKFGFPGVIGAVDGTHVAIIAPKDTEECQGFIYINRKSFHSLNVQLICDSDLMIINVNAKFPGSSHDSFVWRSSGVRHALSRHHETGSWLLGDAGYPLEPWLLTPVPSPTVGSANERYNKKHATARNCIERCIGVLKSRFRCLLHARELNYEPTTAGKIVNACAVLHNICRHYKLPDIENDCREEPIPPTVFEPSLRAAALKIRDNLILTRF
ncbi:putative nuclease HARBI1 isoform X2 [Stegodyphus dumicola]|uniref:putative nuclease HARBI1 isoform X2 n=1 Tax=Stegodyphus dumicola TaxID=202533 RepID=UPI0015AFFE93|nr:putative nuclease HARBI1 isoform X2 [Stegodyphus dumicola]